MAIISKITPPSGNDYDIRASAIPSGEVDSTSTSTAFTATVPGITALTEGVCVFLRNGVVTSESGFTLNVNGLGAKPCYNNLATGYGTTAPTRDTTIFNINYTMLFIYSSDIVDGGGWICYRGYDSNSNTIGYQVRTNSSTLHASDKFYRYRLLFTSADGTKWVPANTSTSTNATAKRTTNTRPINPFGPIVYYSSTTVIDAGSSPGATALWQQYTLNLGYSFNNTGAALTMSYPASIYLRCTPQTNGSAVMDYFTQSLPTTEDGKIYIFLGRAYSATAIELTIDHPVFYHDGNGIKLWTGTKIPSKTSDLTNDSGFITSADVPEGSVASTTTPKMDGTAAVGTESAFARGDHVHPTDTTRASTATFSTSANGLVPKPSSAATNSYLNSSGTWTTPPNTTYGTATTSANGLMSSADKTLLTSLQNNSITDMDYDGQDESNGYKIIVQTDSLNDPLEEIMIPQASTATHGVVKLDGTASHYLNGTGGWTTPPNTTYGTVTTAANGLMTAADKIKLNAMSTVDNNSTYSLTQNSSDGHKLIWTANGGTPATFTIPDTTYYAYDEQDHYSLVDSYGSTAGTWNKEFTDLWAYKNTNNEYFLANPGYAVLMLQNIYVMGNKISGGTLKICENVDLGFYNQIAYFTSGGMTSQTTGYIDAVSMTDDQTMHLYRIDLDISNLASIGSTVTRTNISNTTFSYLADGTNGAVLGDILSNIANGTGSVAEGQGTTASGNYSHTEGSGTLASSNYSHAEGNVTLANEVGSHAEGYGTTASAPYSHAEGGNTRASSYYSHSEGQGTLANGSYSHAEGWGTTASGKYSHAGGTGSTASQDGAFVHGLSLGSSQTNQVVFGKYNELSSTASLVIGGGTATNSKRNIFTISTYGDVTLAAPAASNSPSVIFQRGTLTDNYNDWQIQDRGGFLYFDQRGQGSGSFSNQVVFNTSGNVNAVSFTGSGASLTNLNASNLTSGTVPSARLPLATTAEAGVIQFDGTSAHYLNGTGGWTTPPSLPSVSASDNGKVLTVVNGTWAAASLPIYEGGIRQ